MIKGWAARTVMGATRIAQNDLAQRGAQPGLPDPADARRQHAPCATRPAGPVDDARPSDHGIPGLPGTTLQFAISITDGADDQRDVALRPLRQQRRATRRRLRPQGATDPWPRTSPSSPTCGWSIRPCSTRRELRRTNFRTTTTRPCPGRRPTTLAWREEPVNAATGQADQSVPAMAAAEPRRHVRSTRRPRMPAAAPAGGPSPGTTGAGAPAQWGAMYPGGPMIVQNLSQPQRSICSDHQRRRHPAKRPELWHVQLADLYPRRH